MQQHEITLEPGCFYHIYNRGINGETVFQQKSNYSFFLRQYGLYLEDYLDTYAYCLLGNHFHLLIRVKDELPTLITAQQTGLHSVEKLISKQFARLFSSYTQSVNKVAARTGPIFESPFKRKSVNSDGYLTALLFYIHANPQLHGIIADFRDYPYSSYQSHLLVQRPTRLMRSEVLDWFGGQEGFQTAHLNAFDFRSIHNLLIE